MRAASAVHAQVYRLTGGRLAGTFAGGAPVLLLTTTGRKSGQRRIVPLLYLRSGDDLLIVASQGGAPRHPGWYLNLTANPDATAQLGTSRFEVRAETLNEQERVRLWPQLVAMYPAYEQYRKQTMRQIPVVRLRRAGQSA